MRYLYALASLFVCLSATSCREELPQINAPDKYPKGNLSQEFDAFWNGMNNNYLFWDVDPTDWDGVYRTYKPLFAQLSSDEKDVEQAYAYYREMTARFVDSHYVLIPSDRTMASIVPAASRVRKRPDFHLPIPNAHYSGPVLRSYLNQNSVVGLSPDSSAVLIAGKIKNTNILYFRIPSFSLKEWYTARTGTAKAVIQYVFDELQQPDLRGIILDVRGNGGGQVVDLNFLVGRLTDKSYVYGANRMKSGMGRLDYLPWVEAAVYPPAGAKSFTKPVVVLADMHSVSMSEATVMAVKALPGGNGRIVGERTWGAMAPIADNNVFNGGGFPLTTLFREVYMSSGMFRYKDGTMYEGVGFPPDVEANYDGQALQIGKDTQLEKAIDAVR